MCMCGFRSLFIDLNGVSEIRIKIGWEIFCPECVYGRGNWLWIILIQNKSIRIQNAIHMCKKGNQSSYSTSSTLTISTWRTAKSGEVNWWRGGREARSFCIWAPKLKSMEFLGANLKLRWWFSKTFVSRSYLVYFFLLNVVAWRKNEKPTAAT